MFILLPEEIINRFNIAERLASYSYGLVFGFNTFVALVLQSILTLIVVDKAGLALGIKPQVCYLFLFPRVCFFFSAFHMLCDLIKVTNAFQMLK